MTREDSPPAARPPLEGGDNASADPWLVAFLRRFLGHGLVQDVLILFGVQISAYLLPLVTLPYLAQRLGPGNFGLLAMGAAMAQYFLVVSEYGFAVTGTRRVALVQMDLDAVSRVYSTVMACKVALILLGFAVLLLILALAPEFRAHRALYLVSFLLVTGWGLTPNWLFLGLQRMKFVVWSDYGAKLISVGLIFLLVRSRGDYLLAAAIQSGAFVVSAIIGLGLAFFVIRVRIVWPCWADLREYMIEGWPVFLSMASLTVMSSTNTLILGTVAPPEQVGFLNGASRLLIAARALTNPISNAVYPRMSRLAARSREEALDLLEGRLLWTAAPFLFLTLGMLLFSPLAVRILYGPAYAETTVLLQIMSPSPFIHAVSTCFGTYYMLAFGHQRAWSRIIRRMVVLNFICVAVLMLVMRPARAIALTGTLADFFTAASCILFYRRTESGRSSILRTMWSGLGQMRAWASGGFKRKGAGGRIPQR